VGVWSSSALAGCGRSDKLSVSVDTCERVTALQGQLQLVLGHLCLHGRSRHNPAASRLHCQGNARRSACT
jgi:hypothetical protein